jgi:hypothetical protein
VVFSLFVVMNPRRATIVGSITAWLFLPNVIYELQSFPDYTKASATSVGVLLGTMAFGIKWLLAFRPRWFDLPMLVWCFCPFASSMANGLGEYDGMSESLRQTVEWGLPYFIGRVYFSDLQGLRELAIGIVIGGLVYVPFCLWEIRMSPQLQNQIYGPGGGYFGEVVYGGFRPRVFLRNGLELGMWMTSGALLGYWLWATGSLKKLGKLPFGLLVLALLGTTFLCKSTGSLALLVAAIGMYFTMKWTKCRWPAILLLLAAPCYMGVRASGLWSGSEATSLVKAVLNERRAESLQTRIDNEDMLTAKALQQPAFGWGGWGRSRVFDEESEKDISITDGMWVIAIGTNGLVGLTALYTALLMPLLLLIKRFPAPYWRDPALAPVASMTVLLGLYSLDSLANAFVNPVYLLALGGLTGALGTRPKPQTTYSR